MSDKLSRRDFLKAGTLGVLATATEALIPRIKQQKNPETSSLQPQTEAVPTPPPESHIPKDGSVETQLETLSEMLSKFGSHVNDFSLTSDTTSLDLGFALDFSNQQPDETKKIGWKKTSDKDSKIGIGIQLEDQSKLEENEIVQILKDYNPDRIEFSNSTLFVIDQEKWDKLVQQQKTKLIEAILRFPVGENPRTFVSAQIQANMPKEFVDDSLKFVRSLPMYRADTAFIDPSLFFPKEEEKTSLQHTNGWITLQIHLWSHTDRTHPFDVGVFSEFDFLDESGEQIQISSSGSDLGDVPLVYKYEREHNYLVDNTKTTHDQKEQQKTFFVNLFNTSWDAAVGTIQHPARPSIDDITKQYQT